MLVPLYRSPEMCNFVRAESELLGLAFLSWREAIIHGMMSQMQELNTWRDDDVAFREAALVFLNLKEANRGLSPEEFLTRLQSDELFQFAEAFAHRFSQLSAHFSIFPVAGESADICILRAINDTFGASLLRIASTVSNNPNHMQQIQPEMERELISDEHVVHRSSIFRKLPQNNGLFRQNALSQFRDESVQTMAYQQPEVTTSPPQQSQKARPTYNVKLKSILRQRERIPTKKTGGRKGQKNPEMEVVDVSTETLFTPTSRHLLAIRRLSPKNSTILTEPSPARLSQAKVAKQESATRQSIMKEIERISQILEATNDTAIRAACKSHVARLKSELRSITLDEGLNNQIDEKRELVIDVLSSALSQRIGYARQPSNPTSDTTVGGKGHATLLKSILSRKDSKLSDSVTNDQRLNVTNRKCHSVKEDHSEIVDLTENVTHRNYARMADDVNDTDEAIVNGTDRHHISKPSNSSHREANDLYFKSKPKRQKRSNGPSQTAEHFDIVDSRDDDTLESYTRITEADKTRETTRISIIPIDHNLRMSRNAPTAATKATNEETDRPGTDGPTRKWRAGLFDCFEFGVCHPVVLNSLIFPQVVLAQTWARFHRLTNQDSTAPFLRPFRLRARLLLLLTLGLTGVNIILAYLSLAAPHRAVTVMVTILLFLLNVPLVVIFLHLLIQTRATMRQHYQIPDERFADLEDSLVSVLCTCCTVSQMSRHTLDPSQRATWFSETGLSPQLESKIIPDQWT